MWSQWSTYCSAQIFWWRKSHTHACITVKYPLSPVSLIAFLVVCNVYVKYTHSLSGQVVFGTMSNLLAEQLQLTLCIHLGWYLVVLQCLADAIVVDVTPEIATPEVFLPWTASNWTRQNPLWDCRDSQTSQSVNESVSEEVSQQVSQEVRRAVIELYPELYVIVNCLVFISLS